MSIVFIDSTTNMILQHSMLIVEDIWREWIVPAADALNFDIKLNSRAMIQRLFFVHSRDNFVCSFSFVQDFIRILDHLNNALNAKGTKALFLVVC